MYSICTVYKEALPCVAAIPNTDTSMFYPYSNSKADVADDNIMLLKEYVEL